MDGYHLDERRVPEAYHIDNEPAWAPTNVVAWNEEREARAEARAHADDDPDLPTRADCDGLVWP